MSLRTRLFLPSPPTRTDLSSSLPASLLLTLYLPSLFPELIVPLSPRIRPDTIRCIVASLVNSDDDDDILGGDLEDDEDGGIKPLQTRDDREEDYTDPNWVPEPVDAAPGEFKSLLHSSFLSVPSSSALYLSTPNPSSPLGIFGLLRNADQISSILPSRFLRSEFRSGKASDIISTLVSIYDTRDVIVKELQILLAQKLLAVRDYDLEKEVSSQTFGVVLFARTVKLILIASSPLLRSEPWKSSSFDLERLLFKSAKSC